MTPSDYRTKLTNVIVSALKNCPDATAVWEGGSAATGYTDQFSDLDLNILANAGNDSIFATVEACLQEFGPVSHKWAEPKSFWPDLTQKVYFLENSPKHFFVDVALFPLTATSILSEFMQLERHGKPLVHFDKSGLINPRPADREALKARHRERVAHISAATPVFITEVYKEIDRGHGIDAIGFYHSTIIRPLVELLGILYRPHQFDFGLRYVSRSFPEELTAKIQNLLYVIDINDLKRKMLEAEQLFGETMIKLKDNGFQDNSSSTVSQI